ncbi:pinin/SDK/memA/ protein conserved region-domain-containing protein [Piptocephalis cylindrospora]|uniref:Pinin/SDK/memA/ protein conserved region-domain-containing protein n=1 Tax=Piptocephalis cylindrospora TaxID=1907219 RepID=A0A4P9Y6G8_9FUNG|nr:pinin/SDK/memA/ protein conserved region-domain-containing protein [Piptocephalis cylindrospora]|eukprot:RKP14605.1 pinin/SDK/memA/ protein conserved region-domain-containing protein [Piptocephalis cylindrospora]
MSEPAVPPLSDIPQEDHDSASLSGLHDEDTVVRGDAEPTGSSMDSSDHSRGSSKEREGNLSSSSPSSSSPMHTRSSGPRLDLKDPEVREQGRRMFGLALGTLQAFQSTSKTPRSGTSAEGVERRRKLEEKIQERLMRERSMVADKEKRQERERQEELELKRMILEREHHQMMHRHQAHLAHFLRTSNSPDAPSLYYLPTILTPEQESRIRDQEAQSVTPQDDEDMPMKDEIIGIDEDMSTMKDEREKVQVDMALDT